MKTLLIIALLLSTSFVVCAQSSNFLRVFNTSGKKIGKGQLRATTDSSLILEKGNKLMEIPVDRIGQMITKRSFGNSVLVTSLVIGGFLTTIGLIGNSHSPNTTSTAGGAWNFNNDNLGYSNADIIGFSLITSAFLGTSIGGIIGGTKKIAYFNVNGNLEEWKKVKRILDQKIEKAATKK